MFWHRFGQTFFALSKTGREVGKVRVGRHAVGGEDDEDRECDDPEDLIIFNTTSVRFGSLSTSRSECALKNRAAFLCGKPLYLLYFWEIADHHQLLQSALQRLDNDIAASDASSAPSATCSQASGTNNRRRQQQHDEQEAPIQDILALSQSIRFHAKAEDDRQVRRRIADLQDQARNFRRLHAESDDANSARAQFYADEVKQITDKIASLEQPLIATPLSQNRTPRTPRSP